MLLKIDFFNTLSHFYLPTSLLGYLLSAVKIQIKFGILNKLYTLTILKFLWKVLFWRDIILTSNHKSFLTLEEFKSQLNVNFVSHDAAKA